MALIKSVRGFTPEIGENCFLADNAVIIGDVKMGRDCSIWFSTVLRGDVNSIRIGNGVNIQDGSVLHTLYEKSTIEIGDHVSVGHNVTIHGAAIRDYALIGMGSTIHCQLCVSACPNQVLRPSADLRKLMQPEMSYERGYCRPECTKCSEVCPAGAIRPITKADKSSVQIGHAVWVKKNCIPLTDGVQCGNCARHCPTGAIQMVPSIPEDKDSPKIPVINVERCIGCGACENLCPARLFSAIYVEGHERHRII